jgi:hypothetical protein
MFSRFARFAVLKRGLKVNVADIRKGDWIELDEGKRVIVHNLTSSHSGRGSRSFLVGKQLLQFIIHFRRYCS